MNQQMIARLRGQNATPAPTPRLAPTPTRQPAPPTRGSVSRPVRLGRKDG